MFGYNANPKDCDKVLDRTLGDTQTIVGDETKDIGKLREAGPAT